MWVLVFIGLNPAFLGVIDEELVPVRSEEALQSGKSDDLDMCLWGQNAMCLNEQRQGLNARPVSLFVSSSNDSRNVSASIHTDNGTWGRIA